MIATALSALFSIRTKGVLVGTRIMKFWDWEVWLNRRYPAHAVSVPARIRRQFLADTADPNLSSYLSYLDCLHCQHTAWCEVVTSAEETRCPR
jgi:hypothetical protein